MGRRMRAETEQVPHLVPGHRLHWDDQQHGPVLLYPGGLVPLDTWTSEVLRNCDGTRTVGQIVDALRARYPTGAPGTSVCQCLHTAMENGWISLDE